MPGIRPVAVYAPEAGLVLAQAGGEDPRGAGADGGGARAGSTRRLNAQAQRAGSTRRLNRRRKTGGGKQAAENGGGARVAPRWRRGGAAVAPRLVARGRPLLRGRVGSGDALDCQEARCRRIHAAGGEYLFAVKANQPGLLEDVSLLFCDPPPGEAFRQTPTVDAHGGRTRRPVEQRWLRASTALAGSLRAAGWEGAGPVLEVRPAVRWPTSPERPPRQELRSFLSSLPAQVAARRALALLRQHRPLEHRRQWPRDVTLGEDASPVRSGHAPQARSALRNVVGGGLHRHHVANLAANLAAALRTPAYPCLVPAGARPQPARPDSLATLNDPRDRRRKLTCDRPADRMKGTRRACRAVARLHGSRQGERNRYGHIRRRH